MKTIRLILPVVLSLALSCSRAPLVPDKPQEGAELVRDAQGAVVREFCEDGTGSVWMRLGQRGLLRADGQTIIHYTNSPDNPGSLSADMVNDIVCDGDGDLWVATQKGVDRFDRESGSFIHYSVDDFNSYILRFLKDAKGNLFAQSRRAILRFNPATGIFERNLDFPELTVRDPLPVFDTQGRLWMRLDDRIVRFDQDFQKDLELEWDRPFNSFLPDGANSLLLLDSGRLKALDTSSGGIGPLPPALEEIGGRRVLSVRPVGEDYLLFNTENGPYVYDKVSRMLHSALDGEDPFRSILGIEGGRDVFPDSKGRLWYAARDGGYGFVLTEQGEESSFAELNAFLKDRQWYTRASDGRFIWVLLSDNTLLTYDAGLKRINGITGLAGLTGSDAAFYQVLCSRDGRLLVNGSGRTCQQVFTFTVDAQGMPALECAYSAESGIIAAFDDAGGLWGAGLGTEIYYAPRAVNGQRRAEFQRVEEIEPFNEIAFANLALSLRNGDVLFCYTDNNPLILNPKNRTVTPVEITGDELQVYYYAVLEDSREVLWFGTTDNGLIRYDREDGSLERMGFAGNLGVGDIQEDGAGNLFFLLGDKQLFCWPRQESQPKLLWNDMTGFPKGKKMFIMPDNSVSLFESGHYRTFKAGDAGGTQAIPGPVTVTLSSGDKVLARFVTGAEDGDNTVRLRMRSVPDDLGMSLSVAEVSEAPVYDYMFGINRKDNDLRESVGNADIALYGLSRGRNRIQFKLRRTDYPAESPLYTVLLHVRRPWYFWALLALAAAAAVFMALLFTVTRRRRKEAEKARQERELQEQVNMRNLDFFANISHEFRAPLTLINAAVSTLGDEGSEEDRQHTLGIVRRNVGRMLKLVTQMLDFNKLDHDMLKLNVGPANVPDIIRRSWEIFEIGAGQKNIDFSLSGCDFDRQGFVDADKVEKVIYNLCSNALKFTPPGGRISVDCTWDDDALSVSVSDTGIGLEEDKLDSIFERFSQTEPARKAGGTGIGLYYTKSLVEMHHGHISAENRYADGDREHSVGSVFRFSIPLSESAYSDEEKAAPDDLVMPAESASAQAGTIVEHEPEEPRKDLPTLLLIDDDYELVYYMKSLFSSKYNVYFRFDAMSGYNQVKEVGPDVIICDMMMMDVDGLQFCKMVKENIEMCHIPVIMLTARSSVEDQVNSLNVGADAYVIKPFNPEYLMALVKSMVDNRNRMRQILTTSITTPSGSADKLNIKDKLFMDKLYANLESSLAEGELDIDGFASKLGVSRSKFFYKIKALTGQTPGEFFTTYKLNRAAQLIAEDKYKIATVAAMVGFSSPSHFSAVFKKQFGVLPSQYNT